MTSTRSEAARKGVETKTAALLEEIALIEVSVKPMSSKALLQRTINQYNDHKMNTGNYDSSIDAEIDIDTLERLQVNYLRHQCTNYDTELQRLFARVGKGKGYAALCRKVYDAISAKYPHLKRECDVQFNQKFPELVRHF